MIHPSPHLRLVLPNREWVDLRGVAIRRTFRVAGSTDRIVLFAWATDPEPRRRNLARIDKNGNVVWRSELPGNELCDAFISLVLDGDTFVATTYRDWEVRLSSDGEIKSIAHTLPDVSLANSV